MAVTQTELARLTVGQIVAEQKRHDDQVARVRADAARVLGVTSEEARRRIRDGQIAAADAKIAELERAHQAKIDDLRAEALGYLNEARGELETRRYKELAALGPQTPEEWTAADARALFIQEDLGGLEPSEIVKRHDLAQRAGDRVGAWLIARYGLRALAEAQTNAPDMGAAARANLAQIEVNRAAYGATYQGLQAAEAELAALQHELRRPVTRGELLNTARDFTDRMGGAIGQTPEQLVEAGVVDQLPMPGAA